MKKIIFIFISILSLANYAYPETTVILDTGTLPVTETDIGAADIAIQLQDITDKNGPFVADAFTLANVLGYPIGKAYLGGFPHFELGIAGGAGCTNMKYFDENEPAHDNGTLPVIAPNPIAHFGLGIGGGFDILGKFFYISKSAITRYYEDAKLEYDLATIQDFKIYSAGGKVRYNIIKKKKILPLYLSLGGVTLSLGGDFIYGNIKVSGDYEHAFTDINVSGYGPVTMNFDGQYIAEVKWSIFSLNAQAIGYLDIFYFFSLYTGFGLAGNVGSFDIIFSGTGDLTTTSSAYYAALSTYQVGTLTFESQNEYRAFPVLPTYIIGTEINLLVIKINIETMVSMLNRSDVNVQIGTRMQI